MNQVFFCLFHLCSFPRVPRGAEIGSSFKQKFWFPPLFHQLVAGSSQGAVQRRQPQTLHHSQLVVLWGEAAGNLFPNNPRSIPLEAANTTTTPQPAPCAWLMCQRTGIKGKCCWMWLSSPEAVSPPRTRHSRAFTFHTRGWGGYKASSKCTILSFQTRICCL